MKTRLTLLLMVALSSASASAAYMRDDGLSQWPVSPSGPLFIDVCFESLSEPTSGTPPVPMATLRGWIADGVRSTWGRHARIVFRFDMTTACGPNSTSYIRIGWSDTNPSVAMVGAKLRGIPNGMVLARWMTSGQVTDCPGGQYELCTKNDVIHEFGHALGFFHEEEHPDRTFSSVGELEGRECDTGTVTGGRRIGAYDLNSVMSPCGRAFKAFPWSAANRWSTDINSNAGRKVELSVNDIAAVQKVYGRHQAGSLMSQKRCLSAHWYSPMTTGNYPFTHDCDENWLGQEWWMTYANTESVGIHVTPNLAPSYWVWLDGFYGTYSPAEIREYNFRDHFEWSLTDASIIGFGGLCLDVWGGATSSQVRMAWCAGTANPPGGGGALANQRWSIDLGAKKLRWAANPAYCLTRQGGSIANGTTLGLTTCSGASTFEFFSANGAITTSSSGVTKCLDVQGPTEEQWLSGSAAPNSGAAVQIWDCSPVLGQQWHMRTRLKNVDDGRCLDANGGDQLQVPNGQTCGSDLLNIQQLWDYYPGHLSNW